MRERFLELDARLTERLRVAERPGPLRTLAAILAHSGDSWFWLAGLLLLWWRGTVLWRSRALSFIIAILVTAAVVMGFKLIFHRTRPAGEWGSFYRNTDPHSFPSGHATRAFMLAVMAIGLGPAWLAIALVVWAPLVSLARAAMGVHYISDVLAGIILGVIIGAVLTFV
jgi:undecaprenyl-diphosphatase